MGELAIHNKILGQFNLEGIPSAPRGVPQIEVTFDIDVNGIVHVSATDKASGMKQKITIKASGGLKENEIDEMIQEAKKNAEEDKKRKDFIETKNQGNSLIYSVEKSLKNNKEKVSEEDTKNLQEHIKKLNIEINKENNINKCKEAI